jgi:hypothetical protein
MYHAGVTSVKARFGAKGSAGQEETGRTDTGLTRARRGDPHSKDVARIGAMAIRYHWPGAVCVRVAARILRRKSTKVWRIRKRDAIDARRDDRAASVGRVGRVARVARVGRAGVHEHRSAGRGRCGAADGGCRSGPLGTRNARADWRAAGATEPGDLESARMARCCRGVAARGFSGPPTAAHDQQQNAR